MDTLALAQVLESDLSFDFAVEGQTAVSHISTDMYSLRLEVEELPSHTDEGSVIQVSVIPGYDRERLFDFRNVMPRCQGALFALQSATSSGRLELRPFGEILTVALREKADVPEEDSLEDYSLEEVSADMAEQRIGRLLYEMCDIVGLLRGISLTGSVDPATLQLLETIRVHGRTYRC